MFEKMPKILSKMPPFSWSKGYWKFGVVFTVYSFVANYVFAWCIMIFGLFYQPVLWILFSLLAWTVKPLMIDRMRPCSDCPKRIYQNGRE